MVIATHPGGFHADDVFAIATLRLALGDGFEVIRTRDPEKLAAADMRVDVGMRFDPETGDFDHHQNGRAGERPNGLLYASFGLVWRHYGPGICGSAEAAERVDRALVQGIDATDNGQQVARSLISDGAEEISMAALIGAFNPEWDDEETDEDEAFAQAVEFAKGILSREISSAQALLRAEAEVRRALERRDDERLLFLERNMPWKGIVISEAPEVLFVIYPKPGEWCAQAVPKRLGTFDNKASFPRSWAGLQAEELREASGVPDAVFCHAAGFFAVARSREGIEAMIAKTLAKREKARRRRRHGSRPRRASRRRSRERAGRRR